MANKVINLFDNLDDNQNEDVKYSRLIDKFIIPFEDDFPEDFHLRDVFEFAVHAWNFGNISKNMPENELEGIMAASPNQDLDFILLKKMIAYKISNFNEYSRFISGFEINEVNGAPELKVISESAQSYFEDLTDDFSFEPSQSDFEENYVDRSAIIIKPKQPFLDWLNNLYPEEDQITEINEGNIYLVDDDIDDLEKWLQKNYDKFFCMELHDWHTNKKDWPKKRNFKMFKLWFNAEISTMVYDLEKRPIQK